MLFKNNVEIIPEAGRNYHVFRHRPEKYPEMGLELSFIFSHAKNCSLIDVAIILLFFHKPRNYPGTNSISPILFMSKNYRVSGARRTGAARGALGVKPNVAHAAQRARRATNLPLRLRK